MEILEGAISDDVARALAECHYDAEGVRVIIIRRHYTVFPCNPFRKDRWIARIKRAMTITLCGELST